MSCPLASWLVVKLGQAIVFFFPYSHSKDRIFPSKNESSEMFVCSQNGCEIQETQRLAVDPSRSPLNLGTRSRGERLRRELVMCISRHLFYIKSS